MGRVGLILCALILSGCNSLSPGASAPEASTPASPDQIGIIVAAPLADLDCEARAGAISCD